jgi:type II secretory pathway pseudopilin PulG
MSRSSAKPFATNRKGMSLLELVVVLGIMVVVVTVISAIFSRTYKSYTIEAVSGQQQLSVRSALNRIVREGRVATSVVDSFTSGSTTYTASSNVLILQLASVDSSQTIIPSTYDYLIYRVNPSNNAKFQEVTIPGTGSSRKAETRTLANNFSNFTVTYYDANNNVLTSGRTATKKLKLSLSVSQKYYQANKNQTLTYTNQVTLRNK